MDQPNQNPENPSNESRKEITPEILTALFSMAQEAGLLSDPEVQDLLFNRIARSKEPWARDIQRFRELVEPTYNIGQARKSADPFYKHDQEREKLSKGDLTLGIQADSEGLTSFLLKKPLNKNESPIIGVYGESGYGKSGFITNFLIQWCQQIGKGIVFDREGGYDYQNLINLIPNSIILTPSQDRDSLIRCKGIDDYVALNDFCDVLSSSTYMHASGVWLKQHIEAMMKEGQKPTLHGVLNSIRQVKKKTYGNERNYIDSGENRLSGLCAESSLAKCVSCIEGISPESLLEYDLIIFDISSLSESDQYFYSSMKMVRFMRWLENHPFDQDLLFVCDEGDNLFGNKRDAYSRQTLTPPHQTIALRGRKRGIKVLIGTPLVSNISEEALNASLLVCFCLKSSKQQSIIAQSLGLTPQEATVLGELPPRTALVRI